MTKKRSIHKLIWILLCLGLWACQSTADKPDANERGVASELTEEQEFEKSFSAWMGSQRSKIDSAQRSTEDLRALQNEIREQADHLARGLARSFYFLVEQDRKLEEALKDCENNPNVDCPMISEFDEYKSLQVYRSLNEKNERRLKYFYLRLSDLANAQDDRARTLFSASQRQLEGLSEADRASLAGDARGLRQVWDSWLSEQAQNAADLPLMERFLVEKLIELRNEAIKKYSELSGLEPRTTVQTPPLDNSVFFENNKENIRQEFRDTEDLPEFEKLFEQYKEESRSPDSANWINHTGRNFPANQWALTYDDGPAANTTRAIIDLLNEAGYHATFFWLAQNAGNQSQQGVIRRADQSGMGLANHSYTHANLVQVGPDRLRREISGSRQSLEAVYGKQVRFFRLPYGAGTGNSRVRQQVVQAGMEHFFWNVDSLDWQDPSPQSIANRVFQQMRAQGRGIILLHDIHQKTVAATRLIIDHFRSNPQLQVIPLEQGVGRPANPSLGSGGAIGPIADAPKEFPHFRRILTNTLNIRPQGGVSQQNPPCGYFTQATTVQVIGQDESSGWFAIDTDRDRPLPPAEDPSRRCPNPAFISNGGSFTHSVDIL